MSVIDKIRRHGVAGSTKILLQRIEDKTGYLTWKFRNTPRYVGPTSQELLQIEQSLLSLGVEIQEYTPAPDSFKTFRTEHWFPVDYHGGQNSGVWDEKLLEHWIASERLGLMSYSSDGIYVDVAACNSPWAQELRKRKSISAFAIDLCEVGALYKNLDFYRMENATATSFADASVSGVSLHCAYEMFMGEDDRNLIAELARILRPGGKAVILPLYMHTHYCTYSTPEYFGKGCSDPTAVEYVRLEFRGVPSSRKYDAKRLKERVLEPIVRSGMSYRILVLRNKQKLGDGIYCHFILEIEK